VAALSRTVVLVTRPTLRQNRDPLIVAACVLGVGLGGFADGILFHQVLQLHGMLSARVPRTSLVNADINMFWDGLFHAFTWGTTLVGLGLLWRATGRADVPHAHRTLLGGMLGGWGLFQLVEGLIDHQLLGVHHVVENGNHALGDALFLLSGVVFLAIGWYIVRGDESRGA
jgi:uncharacterized membrane protein